MSNGTCIRCGHEKHTGQCERCFCSTPAHGRAPCLCVLRTRRWDPASGTCLWCCGQVSEERFRTQPHWVKKDNLDVGGNAVAKYVKVDPLDAAARVGQAIAALASAVKCGEAFSATLAGTVEKARADLDDLALRECVNCGRTAFAISPLNGSVGFCWACETMLTLVKKGVQ